MCFGTRRLFYVPLMSFTLSTFDTSFVSESKVKFNECLMPSSGNLMKNHLSWHKESPHVHKNPFQ
ncbi:CLUMA_CG011260, isoform A [Clunio marinus]|uniref:CLUMA_CG011260, isoform A n=1 Tax=Clunio marinus TaxID=568069 RepID=A0A1J1IC72_9DIPT|nr:CLUMA_CG011260, isoform A [Clunio marinus]